MTKGSCNCGDWTYEYEGEPAGVAVCHCIPCQKTAGSNGSTNSIIPNDKFHQKSGKTKNWTRKGESGKSVTYNICDTCGTIMTVSAEAMPDITILKNGTLDDRDELDKTAPGLEVYTRNRPSCVAALSGVTHKEGGS